MSHISTVKHILLTDLFNLEEEKLDNICCKREKETLKRMPYVIIVLRPLLCLDLFVFMVNDSCTCGFKM